MNFYEYDINSNYGTRVHPITNEVKHHNGIDYDLPMNTEVLANVSGTVTKTNYEKEGFGNYVVVKDGTGKLHYYAHLNKSSVNVGDIVNVNDVIGLSGSTGMSTGPHLHYEVRENGKSINPSQFTSSSIPTITGDLETDMKNFGYSNRLDEHMSYYDNNPNNDGVKTSWFDNTKDKIKNVVFNIFKFIIIALIIVLFVIFVTKAMDINIL